MKLFIAFFCLLLLNFRLASQERIGMASGNYAGTNAMMLNPASMVNSPYKWDLNLVTFHTNVDNNALHISNSSLIGLINKDGDYLFNNVNNSDVISSENDVLIDLYKHSRKKFANALVMVQGPSLIVSANEWSFGFHTAIKLGVSAKGISNDLKDLYFQGLSYTPNQNQPYHLPRTRINEMAWNEIGLSIGKVLKNKGYQKILGGITLKRLRGYNSAFINIRNVDFEVQTDTSVQLLYDFRTRYGYAPGDFEIDYLKNPLGRGIGADIGIIIENTKPQRDLIYDVDCPHWDCVEKELYYKWRLGISLMDVGYIRFKEQAHWSKIKTNSNSSQIYRDDLEDIINTDVSNIDSIIETAYDYGDISIESKDKFNMWLPWALSVQYDRYLLPKCFVNATIVHAIPHFGGAGIDRPHSIALTPRYENKRFGIAIPFVLYNYLYPRLGFSIRLLNFLTIGSDRLGPFYREKVGGADLYFALKINRLKRCPKSNRYQYKNRIFEQLSLQN